MLSEGYRPQVVFFAFIIGLSFLGSSCNNGGSDSVDTSSLGTETFTVNDFNVPAGNARSFSGNVIINSATTAIIDGQLTSAGSITIEAEGSVAVSGTVEAGNGSSGNDGGSVTLVSNNSSLDLSGGSIISGVGGKGIAEVNNLQRGVSTVSGGAGGNGGNIGLAAPNGSVIFNSETTISLGNGGDGDDVIIPDPDSFVPDDSKLNLSNAGGDSGNWGIAAGSIEGLSLSTLTLTEDYPPGAEEPQLLAGTTIQLLSDDSNFTGGVGGNAGAFRVGAEGDFDTEVFARKVVYLAGRSNVDALLKVSPATVVVSGANGGRGALQGGVGQSVEVRGKDGPSAGDAGQDVTAFGGAGGDCVGSGSIAGKLFDTALIALGSCTGGQGGTADARGGSGAQGQAPTGEGGTGGSADATGGRGGMTFRGLGGLVTGSGVGQSSGRCGDGLALGGFGGVGGGDCPNNVAARGGRGGAGGSATAFVSSQCSSDGKGAIGVRGGDGGRGGDGRETRASGGTEGSALSPGTVFRSKTVRDGDKGRDGFLCKITVDEGTGTSATEGSSGSESGTGNTVGSGDASTTGGSGTSSNACSNGTYKSTSSGCGIGTATLGNFETSSSFTLTPFGENITSEFQPQGSGFKSTSSNLTIFGAKGHTCTVTCTLATITVVCTNTNGGRCEEKMTIQ